MARYALIFLAAALLCTAVLAQDVTPAHRGGKAETFSSFDSASQRYRPVKCGRNLCLYRIRATLRVDTYNRNQPSPGTFATTVAVYTGVVLDHATNVTTGSFEAAGIATTQPASPTDTVNVLENYVLEFGPERDDAITATGNSQISPATFSLTDRDLAVTGGTGQFLGAYGAFAEQPATLGANTLIGLELTIYVPNNKL